MPNEGHYNWVCTVCEHNFETIFWVIITSFYYNLDKLPFKIQNGQFHTYCKNMYVIIHQNKMVTIEQPSSDDGMLDSRP